MFLHELVCATFGQVRPEDIGCPGVGVTGVGELPDVGAGTRIQGLCKSSACF